MHVCRTCVSVGFGESTHGRAFRMTLCVARSNAHSCARTHTGAGRGCRGRFACFATTTPNVMNTARQKFDEMKFATSQSSVRALGFVLPLPTLRIGPQVIALSSQHVSSPWQGRARVTVPSRRSSSLPMQVSPQCRLLPLRPEIVPRLLPVLATQAQARHYIGSLR